jgi:TPP-dependent pyruvate/acetoin dehydrogenase alpha subunit
VLENNGWSQSTPLAMNFAGDMVARFTAFDLPVREVDSTDVLEIDRVAKEELALMRRVRGPRVLIVHTYRLCHHSKSDDQRPAEEIAERWTIEPLAIHGPRLSGPDRARIDAEVEEGMREVVERARALP